MLPQTLNLIHNLRIFREHYGLFKSCQVMKVHPTHWVSSALQCERRC